MAVNTQTTAGERVFPTVRMAFRGPILMQRYQSEFNWEHLHGMDAY